MVSLWLVILMRLTWLLALMGFCWQALLPASAEQKGFAVVRGAEQPGRGRRRVLTRLTACGVTAASLALCLYATPSQAAPKPPPNPTDQQLSQAAQQKRSLAQAVGVLSAQIAQAQARLQTLAGQAELAEQKYALAVSKLNDAKEQATKAQADVVAAQQTNERALSGLSAKERGTYFDLLKRVIATLEADS